MNDDSQPREARKSYQWIFLAIGPIMLVILLWRMDLQKLWNTVIGLHLDLFLLACTILLVSLFVRALRWRLLLSDIVDETPPVWDLAMIFAYSNFVGIATPGRVGEFVKSFHLRSYGVPLAKAVANVLTDHMLDVIFLLAIALFSFLMIVVPEAEQSFLVPLSVVIVVGGIIVSWLFFRSDYFDPWVQKLKKIEVRGLQKVVHKFSKAGGEFRSVIQEQKFTTIFFAILLTLVAWALVYLGNWYIAKSFDLELSYFQIIAVSSVSSLAAQLPISVLGVGTRDATMVLILAKYGVAKESALVLSLLFLASMLAVALVCAFSILTAPVRFARKN